MRENKIFIFNKHNEKLAGLEAIPKEKKEKYSAIILVHGFGVTKEEYGLFDGLATALSDSGFIVYRFDFAGRGESEGDYSKTSITKMMEDLELIIEFIKSQYFVNINKIGILAQSFGTSVVASLIPEVNTIIFTGSIFDPISHTNNIKKWDVLDKKGISIKTKKTSGEIIKIGPQFWTDLEKHDLLKNIKKINFPILFIHGSEDKSVPIESMEKFYENANEPKEKIIIQGAEHGMEPKRDKLNELVIEWFKKYL
ncbi:lysophospholipase [Candidatus Woesearchaeota archaeon]|nr:lysophospholipase [Candidatus Woesearchaeota archaeon]MCF7900589.1 lysophospholipase [Candidatus Woesearchaeota archaeon]MCF8013405.1 lysophospholipase [Candidatus Woesearchaeota archaeon]